MALTRLSFPAPTSGSPSNLQFAGGRWFAEVQETFTAYAIYWSDDLSTWTEIDDYSVSASTESLAFVGYANGKWFLRRNDTGQPLMWSSDMTTWTVVSGMPAGFAEQLRGIAHDGTTYVIVCGSSAAGPGGPYHTQFAKSTNLTSWTTDIVLGSTGLTWPYGGAENVKWHDGRWFLHAQDGVVLSPVTRTSVITSTDLTAWTTVLQVDDNNLVLRADSSGLYVARTTPGAGRVSRWDDTAHAFVATATESTSELYDGTSVGHYGSAVAQVDDDGGWGTFANFAVFPPLGGAWLSRPIGTPTAPVVFANDVYYWLTADAGTMFFSENAGTIYLDFLDAEIFSAISVPSPLGAPAIQFALTHGTITVPSPIGAASLLGVSLVSASADVQSPLGQPAVLALHDFTAVLGDAVTYYVMDLETPGGLVRVPISSWQATIQTDEMCYVQCVVPACTDWVEDLGDATEFVISRRVVLADDSSLEYEMARAPLQTLSLAQGPTNYSATLSGYTAALTADDDPPAVYDRDLTGVRAIFVTGGNVRARSSIDWLLRPGHRAFAGETEIVVDFISYYVGGGDAYMDVGQRA